MFTSLFLHAKVNYQFFDKSSFGGFLKNYKLPQHKGKRNIMLNINDVGGFKDYSGREIRVALFSEKYLPYSFQVWIKKNYSPWIKQKDVFVQNSEKALSWAKEQIASERIF